MRPTSGVHLGLFNLDTAALRLKGQGAVDLSNICVDDNGANKHLFVRSRSRFQELIGHLSLRKTREAHADQVCRKLTQVLGTELTAVLMQDVRRQIIKTGSLKGDFLAQKLEDLHDVHKSREGQRLRTRNGSPMQTRSDCCIVGFATANAEMQKKLNGVALNSLDWMSASLLGAWGNRDGNFSEDKSLSYESKFTGESMAKLVCLRGRQDAAWSQSKPGDMYRLIHQAIGESTGAIVIEPQPDKVVNGKPIYTDAGLREQILAARDRKNEAIKQGIDRVITFVSPNGDVLADIQRLHTEIVDRDKAANSGRHT